MTVGLRSMLACGGLLLAGQAAASTNSLLNSDAVLAFRGALQDLKSGKKPRAEAVLKGILLNKVRVAVDPQSLTSGRASMFEQGVRDGVEVWSDSLPDSPFVYVGPGEPADVRVRFVSEIDRSRDIQGLVRAERSFFYSGKTNGYRLKGELLIRNHAHGKLLSAEEVSRIAAHELGHLLGLDDRYYGNGLMGAFTPGPGRKKPSSAELAAVVALRKDVRAALSGRVTAAQISRRKKG